jgi:hypothetical protein
MYDIITIGSATVDAFVNTGSRLFKGVKKNYVRVPFGSKILVKELRFDVGGGGTKNKSSSKINPCCKRIGQPSS